MNSNRMTRSSVRSRGKNPAASSSSAGLAAHRSNSTTSKTSSNIGKSTTSSNRLKPNERPSSSRLTRSSAPKTTDKRPRDDEGPRVTRIIQVGTKYQAKIPEFNSEQAKPSVSPDRETCVWEVDEDQDDKKIQDFCVQIHEKLNMNSERALYHLYINNFDYKKAMKSAADSSDLSEEWSENDKYCFHGLFSAYGRDFKKIHQIMAHKSMRSIVEHYYRVKLQNNYASIVDRDAIGYDTNRKPSTDDKEPKFKPKTCQNCGTRALLYHINNQMQCLACRRFFEEFNCNRTLNYREKPLNFKFADEIMGMVSDFKEMCETQSTGKSKCEEIKQNAIHNCRLLRSEALRKDVNAGRIVQKVVSEVNLDEYKKLLTTGNAPSSRCRITNVWTGNEKNLAVQALIRYGGNKEAAASILGTKTSDMIGEFYTKYAQVLNEAIKTKPGPTVKRREQADKQYNTMLNELGKDIEVVDID